MLDFLPQTQTVHSVVICTGRISYHTADILLQYSSISHRRHLLAPPGPRFLPLSTNGNTFLFPYFYGHLGGLRNAQMHRAALTDHALQISPFPCLLISCLVDQGPRTRRAWSSCPPIFRSLSNTEMPILSGISFCALRRACVVVLRRPTIEVAVIQQAHHPQLM